MAEPVQRGERCGACEFSSVAFVQVKFGNALVHMASNKIKMGTPGVNGEIRRNCRLTNAGVAATTTP